MIGQKKLRAPCGAGLCLATGLAALFLAQACPAAAAEMSCDALLANRDRPTALPRLKRALARGTEVRIVDFGPPLGDPASVADPGGPYAARLQAGLRKALLHAGVQVATKGAADDSLDDALARLRLEFSGQPPDFAIWRIGDIDPMSGAPISKVAAVARLGMDLVHAAGVELAIVGPAPGPAGDPRPIALSGSLGALARDSGTAYIDRGAGRPGDAGLGLRLDTTVIDFRGEDSSVDCLVRLDIRAIVEGVRAQR